MAKNTFKKSINERYKGRGNSWVKVNFDEKAFLYIKDLYNKVSDLEKQNYICHTEREGFAWIRFKKVLGSVEKPIVLFEVRLKGSKIDQPEYSIEIPDDDVKDLALLGNTPLKLQLETNLKSAKEEKPSKNVKKSSLDQKNNLLEIAEDIRVIKEAALSKPSSKELSDWYEFLKINNIYEESSWQ